ncbi:MAG TPA: DUF1553 domain-containing protein, partial [Pirellulaceae bacterium]|nr:DUF1553 domain-containing protein [Pirellulaceae bacterium]
DGQLHGWHATGGFVELSRPGAYSVFPGGELILSGFYPSGRYSHLLSERTGGALRSPNFTLDMAFLSAQVTGLDSRLRLVIENFEGNDLLYSQVTPRLGDRGQTYWVTLPIRDNWRGRRAYLELVPRDDVTNVGVVKETAKWGNDGRSSAGLCRVVAHDSPGAPPPTSTIPSAFWRDDATSQTPPDWKMLAERLTALTRDALDAWLAERMTDEQARWLLSLLRAGLLDNSASSSAGPVALRYRAKEQSLPIPQRVVGVTDEESIDERVFARGDSRRPGEVQPRRFLELLGGRAYSTQGSGRRELAEDLIRPDNPLVARVIVNRLWQHAFGRGLVASVDNFGQLGDQPTHPELLDWLAIDFVEHGWSLKHALRQMLTSRAFRGSSNTTSRQFELDPENRLFARANIRRLEAEALRDAVLVASGRLDRRMGGLSIPVALPTTIADHQKPVSGPLDGAGRRSLYLEVRRNFMSPLLTAFDFPKPVATTGVRNVTNVPAQSLALLNDPLLVEQATLLARRTIAARPTVRDRAAALHSAVLMRRPTDSEVDALVSLAGRLQSKAATEGAQQGTQTGGGPSNSGAPGGAVVGGAVTGVGAPASDNVLGGDSDVAARVWRDVALTLMNLKEFR